MRCETQNKHTRWTEMIQFFSQANIKSQQQEQQAREHTRYILSMVQLPSTNVLSALTVLGARGSVVYTNGKQSEWL